MNTTLEFDVTLNNYGTVGNDIVRFQNNIQSIFSRVRLLYGSTPLEGMFIYILYKANSYLDIINYNVIVRNLTEWSGTGQQGVMDQSTMANGIGGVTFGMAPSYTGAAVSYIAPTYGYVNVRQFYIQGIDTSTNTTTTATTGVNGFAVGYGIGNVPNGSAVTGLTTTGGTATGGSGTAAVGYCTRRYQINFALGLFTQDKLVSFLFCFC